MVNFTSTYNLQQYTDTTQTDFDMHCPIGIVWFGFALTLGVIMMVFDGFEIPCALVFCAQRVIETDMEGPLIALLSVGDQVVYDKTADWFA
jgi:hypothetical protein